MNYEIDISIDPSVPDIHVGDLRVALVTALQIEGVAEAVLSVSVVDNATIHQLNRDHLQHNYPTDVISFGLDWSHPDRDAPGNAAQDRSKGARIEGEIIASVDYARTAAPEHGGTVQSELALYLVHGMLHVCGYDDLDPVEKSIMRAREATVLTPPGRPMGASLDGVGVPSAAQAPPRSDSLREASR